MIINRLKAAYLAFKTPNYVYDGKMLCELAQQMELSRGFCVFTGDYVANTYIPRFEMLPYEMQRCIKDHCKVNV